MRYKGVGVACCRDIGHVSLPHVVIKMYQDVGGVCSISQEQIEMAVSHTTKLRGNFPACYAWVFNSNNPGYFFTIAFESSLPGEKRTRSLAGTVIFWLRSRGLTPWRAALRRTLNEPKLTRRTSWPCSSDSRMLASVASSTSAAFFWVSPERLAMFLVISCRPTIVDVDSLLSVFFVAIG